MNQSYAFDMGGVDLKGTWKNYRTGEVYTIRDTIIDEGKICGISMSGGMVPYAVLQNCVKVDPAELEREQQLQKERNNVLTRPSTKVDKVPEVKSNPIMQSLDSEVYVDEVEVCPVKTKVNPAIVTVLDDLTSSQLPKVTVSIKWDEVPEGVKILNKYLKIDVEDIVRACCQRYVNMDDIKKDLEAKLSQVIRSSMVSMVPKDDKKVVDSSNKVKKKVK